MIFLTIQCMYNQKYMFLYKISIMEKSNYGYTYVCFIDITNTWAWSGYMKSPNTIIHGFRGKPLSFLHAWA